MPKAKRTNGPKAKRINGGKFERTWLDVMAEDATRRVLAESTRMHLEKMAEKFVNELRQDPSYREQLREAARRGWDNVTRQLGSRRGRSRR